jgi:hypothetical protein
MSLLFIFAALWTLLPNIATILDVCVQLLLDGLVAALRVGEAVDRPELTVLLVAVYLVVADGLPAAVVVVGAL